MTAYDTGYTYPTAYYTPTYYDTDYYYGYPSSYNYGYGPYSRRTYVNVGPGYSGYYYGY
jgi:hypothetical protein